MGLDKPSKNLIEDGTEDQSQGECSKTRKK